MQWKDKCASHPFSTKILTHGMCRVSLVAKYTQQMQGEKIDEEK